MSEVILAADTKIVAVQNEMIDAGSACKIGTVGNLAFAAVGLLGDAQGKFNLPEIVRKCSLPDLTAAQIVANFKNAVQVPLLRILQAIKTRHPAFRREMAGQNALEIAFGAVENGVPFLHVSTFAPNGGAEFLEVQSFDAENMRYAPLGYHAEIDKFINQNPDHLFADGWRPSLERLIGLEANAHPERVALPITILHITENCAQWL